MNKNRGKIAEIAEAEQNPNSGHYYKRLGNENFSKTEYTKAIENYTKAIELNDTESVFYSNRARCHKMLQNYKQAYEDSKLAIELDDTNIKGHLLCGQMLAEMGKLEKGTERIDNALSRMIKSLTLCAGQGKQDFERDLNRNILKVKKLRWYKLKEISEMKLKDALDYVKDLIKNDLNISELEKEKRMKEITDRVNNPKNKPDFTIPEYLCCKLTSVLMEDPVTTQAGYTYEKKVLLDHINKNGYIDPVTREPISSEQIYANLNIKQAIEIFLKDNPWAFEFKSGETIVDIIF